MKRVNLLDFDGFKFRINEDKILPINLKGKIEFREVFFRYPINLDDEEDEIEGKGKDINTTSSIEYLNINYSSFDKEINKKKLEKIISMNNLKYFDIYLYNLYNDEISKIPGENKSIE